MLSRHSRPFLPENFLNLILIGVFRSSTCIMYHALTTYTSLTFERIGKMTKMSIHVTQPEGGESEQGAERRKTTR